MERSTYKKSGLTIIYGAVVVGLLWTSFIIFTPEVAFSAVNNISVKLILLLVGNIVIGAFGLSLYKFFHLPSPRRYLLFFSRMIMLVGVLAAAAPPSLAAMQKIQLQYGDETQFLITFGGASIISAIIFGTSVIALIVLSKYYIEVSKYETRHGPLI